MSLLLAGAFSAYRYIALKNDALGHGPLNSYFKGEHLAGYDADVFVSPFSEPILNDRLTGFV